jgi:CheY-like chemotaxis protein
MNQQDRPILLVEDNPMDVDLTRRAFARRKIPNPIVVARDGEEALDFIKRWERGEVLPVVILLDLKLPKVDGLEVLRRLKTHLEFQKIPVVIISTSTEDADIQWFI